MGSPLVFCFGFAGGYHLLSLTKRLHRDTYAYALISTDKDVKDGDTKQQDKKPFDSGILFFVFRDNVGSHCGSVQ